MKQLTFKIQAYCSEFPCYLFHELTHFLFVVCAWAFGYSSFPKLIIDRLAYANIEPNGDMQTFSFTMRVTYSTPKRYIIFPLLVCISPMVGTLFLFIISPYWLWLFYIANINTLMLSGGDIVEINKRILTIKRLMAIKESQLKLNTK